MPVHVAPQAADPVEILASFDIDKRGPLRSLDDERFVLRHLREGMPNGLAVVMSQLVKIHGRHSPNIAVEGAHSAGARDSRTNCFVLGLRSARPPLHFCEPVPGTLQERVRFPSKESDLLGATVGPGLSDREAGTTRYRRAMHVAK